jgi:hypothetical protein
MYVCHDDDHDDNYFNDGDDYNDDAISSGSKFDRAFDRHERRYGHVDGYVVFVRRVDTDSDRRCGGDD